MEQPGLATMSAITIVLDISFSGPFMPVCFTSVGVLMIGIKLAASGFDSSHHATATVVAAPGPPDHHVSFTHGASSLDLLLGATSAQAF